MLINWYPGHMHKARRKVKEILPRVDVVIEILDARIPHSSTNPMIETLRGEKPFLKVLSKSDLADPAVTEAWQAHFKEQRNMDSLAITTDNVSIARTIPDRVLKMIPSNRAPGRPPSALIMGIPNVGKSTLINTLAGRKIANVGNEPAITKTQQNIKLSNGLMLIDTPGMTWPGSKNELINYRLATTGAIRDTALQYDDLGVFAMDYMLQRYPQVVSDYFNVPQLSDIAVEALEQVAKRRGCAKGRSVDWNRVGELFVRELRAGKMGPVSFEEPGIELEFRA